MIITVTAVLGCAGCMTNSSSDGVRNVSVVNDSGSSLYMTTCEDAKCQKLASGRGTVQTGNSFHQAIGDHDSQSIAIRGNGLHLTLGLQGAVGGDTRCVVINTGSKVANNYSLSTLPGC